MSTFNEHESKALRHATNIIFFKLRMPILVALLVLGFIAGVSFVRLTKDLPRPPTIPSPWIGGQTPSAEYPPRPWIERGTPRETPSPRASPRYGFEKSIPRTPTPPRTETEVTPIRTIDILLRSVVNIRAGSNSGSGVVVYSDDGMSFILTAAHVVRGFEYVSIGRFTGAVVLIDERTDLALISIELDLQPVELAQGYVQGDKVWSIGLPADRHTFGEGNVVSIGKSVISTAPVYPGMSGGGIFVFQNGGFKLAATIKALGWCAHNCLNLSQSHSVPIEIIRAFLQRAFSV